jgi:hypothetical protein
MSKDFFQAVYLSKITDVKTLNAAFSLASTGARWLFLQRGFYGHIVFDPEFAAGSPARSVSAA